MKIQASFLVLATLLSVFLAEARIVPLSSAPYVKRDAVAEHAEPLLSRAPGESVIHNRVARHIRPEFSKSSTRLSRRQAAVAPTDDGSITDFGGQDPQPVRGQKGVPFLHESNTAIDEQNPDNVSPPPTDSGAVPNLKWSFSLSHSKLLKGGWVREQVVTDLPASKQVAAAEQRLAPYAFRELHWHRVAEWALVLNGSECETGVLTWNNI